MNRNGKIQLKNAEIDPRGSFTAGLVSGGHSFQCVSDIVYISYRSDLKCAS